LFIKINHGKEEMMKDKKTIISKVCKILFIIWFSIYFGGALTNLVFIQTQVFVDLSRLVENDIGVYTYHEKSTKYDAILIGENIYQTTINKDFPIYGTKEYQITFSLLNQGIGNVTINNRMVDNNEIIRISDYIQAYHEVFVFNLEEKPLYVFIIRWLLSISILILFVQRLKEYKYNLLDIFMYIGSENILDNRIKKHILISFLVAAISIVIHYGADAAGIMRGINLIDKGIDIYQMSAALDIPRNIVYYIMPYNPSLIWGFHFLFFINKFLLPFFNPYSYLIVQGIIIKLINMVFMNLTIISVLNYSVEKGWMTKDKLTRVYLFSIYNPLTFYIAIIYIQLDALTVYFLTIAILKFSNLKKEWLLSAVFFALGLSTKMQSNLILPIVLMLVLYSMINAITKKDKAYLAVTIKFVIAGIMGMFIFIGYGLIFKYPIYYMLKNIPQGGRVFTAFAYAYGVYLYLPFLYAFFFIIYNFLHIGLNIQKDLLLRNMLILLGVLPLAFSFGLMHTPSVFMLTLPCFVIVFQEKDSLSGIFISIIALFVCSTEIFSPIGDITGSLRFIGKEPLFTTLDHMLRNSGEESIQKYHSMLFTLAHAVMIALAVYFNNISLQKIKKNGISN